MSTTQAMGLWRAWLPDARRRAAAALAQHADTVPPPKLSLAPLAKVTNTAYRSLFTEVWYLA